MKKKLIATLVAGAVLSTGLIGLTACGNGGLSINKGEEVSKEDWAKAFEATINAESYTIDGYTEYVFKMSGHDDEVGDVDMSGTSTTTIKSYYAKDSSTYSKSTVKVSVSGVPDNEMWQEEYSNEDYVRESYVVKDGDTYYMANYNGNDEEPEWEVYANPYGSIYSATYILNHSFATEEDGEEAALPTLYDAFTYANGVYTATLYYYGDEYTVSVSVKNGYVVGYSQETKEEQEQDGNKSSFSSKTVYNFSNCGSTTVTPSDDAKNAVDNYKNNN